MSMKQEYEVIVIGGGPGGMMAALRAKERGLRVLLIEKNAELGKKLSITGGGRCNITNAEFDIRALLPHYGSAEPFLYSPFTQFGVAETIAFFEARHVPIKIEDRKRAFPVSEKATDVRDALVRCLMEEKVDILLNTPVEGFYMEDRTVVGVITAGGIICAQSFIIASGGKSHADTGSTGEGISWLEEIGHTTHAANPNLVPVVVKESWVHKLSGTTLREVKITLQGTSRKISKTGNILCTHFGFSGPTILNMAHTIKGMLADGPVTSVIDLFPKEDVGSLRERFNVLCEQNQNKNVVNALKEWFPIGVVEVILAHIPDAIRTSKVHSLMREYRIRIVDQMKALPVTITGTMGYDWAIVSDGGVDLKEIDTRTMQSKVHHNLYCVGDILHVQRPSGGYSLQLCWTTGWVAGNSVFRTL